MFNWYFSSDDGQQELENDIIRKIARKIVKAKADGVLEESVKMDYNLNANQFFFLIHFYPNIFRDTWI